MSGAVRPVVRAPHPSLAAPGATVDPCAPEVVQLAATAFVG